MARLLKTELDAEIVALATTVDHRTLGIWACDCAERVLPLFTNGRPGDLRPREAIDACRDWVRTGRFSMKVVRQYALAAHAAAREVAAAHGLASAHGAAPAAVAAARAAGQALGTAHVPAHALAAGIYGATARRDSPKDPQEGMREGLAERFWQLRRIEALGADRRRMGLCALADKPWKLWRG